MGGADVYSELDHIPFTKIGVNYTFYITEQKTSNGTDVITHRIDYGASSGAGVTPGSILYGNFQVQHDLDAFRKTFTPPAACLKNNVLTCQSHKVKDWNKKFFKHE